MNLPKISIVTPSFNQGQYIEETILSIVNQNYPNLEYIIIDGGSTDNTVEIIKKYEKHLAYWVSEKDKGQSEAINKGFRKATGDIVCWINSDDFFMPGSLLKVGERFAKDNSLDLLNGHCLLIDEHSNILSNHFILKQKKWYAESLINGGVYILNKTSFLNAELPGKFSFEADYLQQSYQEKPFFGFVQDKYFIDIGIPSDYNRANEELKSFS